MKMPLTMWFKYNLIYIFARFKLTLAHFVRLVRDRDLRSATSTLHSMQLTSENFDSSDYWNRYPDVADGNIDAFVHFMTFGYQEGREGRFFDNSWYLGRYRDVRALTNNGHDHYIRYGRAESRDVRYMSVCQTYIDKRKVTYPSWLHAHATELSASAVYQDARIDSHRTSPVISILMPVYEPQVEYLEAAINSVLKQRYQHWQLCIADDASKNPSVKALLQKYAQKDTRIKIALRDRNGHISAASNSALEMADGEFIALLDHDDELADDALFWVSEAINQFPNADIIFSDEDKIDEQGRRFDPYFKSDFNYELFLAQNMINHLGVYRRKLVTKIGGFRLGYEGSQDHDLALRVLELTSHQNVHHIPRILYHWRATAGSTALDAGEKNYAATAGLQAIKDHLARIGVPGEVEIAYPKIGHYRVKYSLPKPLPLVSIIIPTRDRVELLKQCVDSIIKLTTYASFEIIIIDNGSVEKETFTYFDKIKSKRVKIIRDDREFNYPALNNTGVNSASGEFVVLMNNDIEIITPDWLEEMVSWGHKHDIGCVGARLWSPTTRRRDSWDRRRRGARSQEYRQR
jgi:glycosyltransferase involved in cell wall biosynthesis